MNDFDNSHDGITAMIAGDNDTILITGDGSGNVQVMSQISEKSKLKKNQQ